MTCVHLRKLYDLCQTHDLKLGESGPHSYYLPRVR